MSATTPDARADALRGHVRLDGEERLYGVVDGARARELASRAWRLYNRKCESLFTGPLDDALRSVSPYVVAFDELLGYVDDWVEHWDRNPGILVVATGHAARVHSHLRKIFVVRDEARQEYFFRYYDPRVLRAFLPTCTGQEIREFFGPTERIYAPDASGTRVVEYVCGALGVRSKTFELTLPA